ncbi:hypothetical protein [Nocardia sp. IFM 10818]
MTAPDLAAYALHLLTGTGITAAQVPGLAHTDLATTAADALRAGWRAADSPIPDVPPSPYEESST